MYVLALTGGLGSGKSTAAEVLAARGAVVLDTDEVAKEMLDAVPALHDRLIEGFGREIIGADGRLDREKLAERAFATVQSAEELNAITHPAVHTAIVGALDALTVSDEPPAVLVLVVPLLVEYPAVLELVDAVLAISANEDARLERAVARGMDREDAERRIARQVGDAERRGVADYVINNDGDVESFRAAVAAFWDDEIAHRIP